MNTLFHSYRRRAYQQLIFVVVLGLLTSCDTTVDVVRSSKDYQYSLYGVLNVAADTQFIRVEPLGDTTQIGAPRYIEADVYLENLDTGTEVALRDSFATIQSDASPPRSEQVHVFWTTRPIKAGTSYRLRVEEKGEAVATVDTRTPSRAPVLSREGEFYLPCCFESPSFPSRNVCPNTFTVEVKHEHRIAAAHVTYPFGERPFPTVNLSDTVESSVHHDGGIIPVSYRSDLLRIHQRRDASTIGCPSLSEFVLDTARVMVAGGGPDWPDWRDMPDRDRYNPGTASNVTGGHGFVGSIYTDTLMVPIEARPQFALCACGDSPTTAVEAKGRPPRTLCAARQGACGRRPFWQTVSQ